MTGDDRPVTGSGDKVRLTVGPVAHGGHCVARHEGRVVFVRHALPGEEVLAELTEAGPSKTFWRADAVEVLTASPDRVPSRCPVSGPGGCGGCDFQHVDPAAQRRLKAAVVAEQLHRLAAVDLPRPGIPAVEVEAVPGDDEGLGWRTRVRFAVDAAGRPGLRRHRSHDVVTVTGCPIAHPRVGEVDVPGRRWPGVEAVEVVAPATGSDRLVVVEPRSRGQRVSMPPLAAPAATARLDGGSLERLRGRAWVGEQVRVDGVERTFRVSGSGFWQVHPGAAQTLLDAVLAAAAPRPGERALDLYSGVGLFSAGLALRVGPQGVVVAVESDPRAVTDARRSMHDLPQVRLEVGRVEQVLDRVAGPGTELPAVDVVVVDPPRAGVGAPVLGRILALTPRVVVLVACDPASMARDVSTAAGLGYRLSGLRAFDLFPMTHHVECVAALRPG